jgi:hypothetical protein
VELSAQSFGEIPMRFFQRPRFPGSFRKASPSRRCSARPYAGIALGVTGVRDGHPFVLLCIGFVAAGPSREIVRKALMIRSRGSIRDELGYVGSRRHDR